MKVTYLLTFVFLLVSCQQAEQNVPDSKKSKNSKAVPLEIEYAKGFDLKLVDGFQQMDYYDIEGELLETYYLVPDGVDAPDKENIIFTPVTHLSLFSTSFIGFLDALNGIDDIKYVENINYVFNEEVKERFDQGLIQESGQLGQLDLEKFILDSPDLVLVNDFQEANSEFEKLTKADISFLPIVEWKEEHPLARAEWIKLFGCLLGKEKLADSLFNEIKMNYLKAKELAGSDSLQPLALFSSLYQDIWYVPGGKSYVAHLLTDANGVSAWSEDSSKGSIALTFEDVFLRSSLVDIWINPDAGSIQELLIRDGRYGQFLKGITLGVFQSNKRVNDWGGNDYWESGVVRPDLILLDFCKMLHPDKFKEVNFSYFQKLND